jgi:hypothetical protein
MGPIAELGVSSSEVSFSIHFPTTCYDEFAKCRQFKRFQSFVSSFPSFGRGFDSHRRSRNQSKIHIDSAALTDRPSLNLRLETGAGLRP